MPRLKHSNHFTAALRVTSRQVSPTERRNPRSLGLDKLSTREALKLMLSEEAAIHAAIRRELPKIEKAVGWIASSFRRRGRLFYTGAGTSGRLGVLDASECPPTFRTDPQQVQGIIAGGYRALHQAVEGAEDNFADGAAQMKLRSVKADDVVVGIAASGTTPFVWGALAFARETGAKTILLCFNPHLDIPRAWRPRLIICPEVGPEILTGSTRLKAGTATKIILNMLSTMAMVRTGKVVSNLMVDVRPTNEKLQHRATGIVEKLTGCTTEQARAALAQTGWNVRRAAAQVVENKPT